MPTAKQVERYHYDGYRFPLPALSADEIAERLDGLDRFEGWLGKPVTPADRKWPSLLVSGRDSGGHFDQLPTPEREFGAAELECHRRVCRRYRANHTEQTEWHERAFAPV